MLSFKPTIITLKNRQDRIDQVNKFYKPFLDEINFFFGLPKDEILKYKSKITTKYCNNFCTIPIIGCATSHILLWKAISEMENGIYMIIEDDTYINLSLVENIFKDIERLFDKYDNLLLQIVGEGLGLEYTEIFNSLTLEKYKYHFFLGCYMITPKVASALYQYFLKNKVSYHIDFVLNNIPDLRMMILRNKELGIQEGLTDSNMKINLNKIFYADNYQRLFYVLNFPIASIFNIIITFNVIFLFLLIILTCFYKNIFMFAIIGIFLLEFIKLDYC